MWSFDVDILTFVFYLCRSGEDLDDNADDGDDLIVPQQQSVKSRQLSDSLNPLVQIFNTLTSALMKSASTTVPKTTAQLIGLNSNEELKGDNGGVSDNDDAYGNYKTFYSRTKHKTNRCFEARETRTFELR